MVRISEDLLRRRAEHNNLEISTLEEVSLHQQDIEKIEHIDKWCRDLKILYLQSNLIPKIENVGRLKKLEYINLALNNIERIENLGGCESLKKIDLTVNFVGELTSIESLRDNYNLREIFLTGNPCVHFDGYREYVIATLPQLEWLDGKKITKTEKILAVQQIDTIKPEILQQEEEYVKKRAQEKAEAEEAERRKEAKAKLQSEKKPGFDGRWYTDINKEDAEKRQKEQSGTENRNDEDKTKEEKIKEIEDENEKEAEFWDQEMPFTPESRIAVHKEIEENKKKEQEKKEGPQVPKRQVRLTSDDGKTLNVNESKVPFSLVDNEEDNCFVLDVACYKYLNTSLIDVDVQPSHIKVVVKGKILQIVLQEEVNPDSSSAQRSKTTGHLVVTMPKAKQVVKPLKKPMTQSRKTHTRQKDEVTGNQKVRHEKLEVDPSKATNIDLMVINDKTPMGPYEGSRRKKVEERPNSEDFVDDPDVPPLI
ncbi:dynein axonemal assembly factor 11-like [Ptychodera flava]|uniref:dynein axonemal assembly factor 11-like n=1 Tax=Ptychodera flava TaxID=63121 RepID=UPI00396AA0B1